MSVIVSVIVRVCANGWYRNEKVPVSSSRDGNIGVTYSAAVYQRMESEV